MTPEDQLRSAIASAEFRAALDSFNDPHMEDEEAAMWLDFAMRRLYEFGRYTEAPVVF